MGLLLLGANFLLRLISLLLLLIPALFQLGLVQHLSEYVQIIDGLQLDVVEGCGVHIVLKIRIVQGAVSLVQRLRDSHWSGAQYGGLQDGVEIAHAY